MLQASEAVLVNAKRELIQEDRLNWEFEDSVEYIVQLEMRDELMAIKTLSILVGAGQLKGLVILRFPAIRPRLAVNSVAIAWDFLDLLPERMGNCGDRETSDPPVLASRMLLA